MATVDALTMRRSYIAIGTNEDDADTPEAVAQKADKAKAIRRCIDQLAREHRVIVDLVYYQEKSISEVAEIVKIPENTVKTRMFHARRRLKALLPERLEDIL